MTNKFTLQIDMRALKACSFCALSKKDVDDDSDFHGIIVEINNTDTIMVGLGRQKMVVMRAGNGLDGLSGSKTFVIPKESIEKIKVTSSKNIYGWLTIDGTDVLIECDESYQSSCVDVAIPDWKRLVPESVSNESAHYRFEDLATMQRILELFHPSNSIQIAQNGLNFGVVCFGYGCGFGVIAPTRHKPTFGLAEWARKSIQPEIWKEFQEFQNAKKYA